MGKHLDLDDVAATSELATKELAELRAALAKARDALALVNKYAPFSLCCSDFHHPKLMQHGDGDFCEPTHMYYHALNISGEALAAIDALGQPEGEKGGA